ncbi:MAG TPA: ABC transporter substrate-binding protein [Chloroflexota bacterium]|nr:ABC transporter substrate-binding protein [Chloroflexota bacterium]
MRAAIALAAVGCLVLAACGRAAAPAASSSSAAATAPAVSKPAASAPVASKGTALNVGYTTNGLVNTPLWVAKERGFFQQNGLDVTLKSLVANAELPALISGELQYDGSGAAGVVAADLEGGNVVLIAAASDYPIYSLFANKKYTSVQDLAGQTIGVTALGSTGEAVARLFLRHYKLEDKVKIAAAGGSSESIMAAMTSGGLAGGVLVPPTTGLALDQGFVELVNGVKLGVPMNHSGIEVTRDYLKAHPAEVRSFLKAYLQAWTYAADPANKPEMLKIIGQYGKVDAHFSELGYEMIVPVWQGKKVPTIDPQSVANVLMFLNNPKAKTAQPSEFIDNSLMEEVARS